MMIRLTCYGIMAMWRRMLSYKIWVRNWAESLTVFATVQQLDQSSKGKRMTSLNDMLRNTIEIPGITFGKLPYFKTLWNYLTRPWTIFENALNQFRYISFIIFDTSVKHLLQAMSHAPWIMAHDSSRARSVHSHPLVHVLWLNRLRQTFENMSAVLGF